MGLLALAALGVGAATAARRRLAAVDEDVRDGAQAATASLVALGAISLASFPLEMPATIALAGIALGLLASDTRPRDPEARARPAAWSVAATTGVALAVGFVVACAATRAERAVRASRWLGVAEHAMHADRGPAGAAVALAALQGALAATPTNYRAELRTSQMLLRETRSLEAARAARDALAIEPYAPDAWTALAAADLEAGDPTTARQDADEALRILEDDPLGLSLRARAAARQGDREAADVDRARLRALAEHSDDVETSRAARELLDRVE
jgi:predicted Zn-dependent protease